MGEMRSEKKWEMGEMRNDRMRNEKWEKWEIGEMRKWEVREMRNGRNEKWEKWEMIDEATDLLLQ